MKNLLACIAAAIFALTSVGAQAGTRADKAAVSFVGIERAAADIGPAFALGNVVEEDDDDDDEAGYWRWLLGFLATAGAMITIIETTEKHRSGGTGG